MTVEGIINWVLELSRPIKRVVSLLTDAALIPLAYIAAKSLRLGNLSLPNTGEELLALGITLVITVLCFVRLGLYRAIIRYIAPKAVTSIFIGASISTLSLILTSFFLKVGIPRTLPFIYMMLLVILIGGTRFAVRGLIQSTIKYRKSPVIIYGAGSAGCQLASALLHGKEYDPIAFVDDNSDLHGSSSQGVRVHSPKDLPDLVEKLRVSKVLLALPSVTNSVRKQILLKLEELPVKVQTVAGMADIVSGNQDISELRDIDVADLLGRDPIAPIESLMEKEIKNKVVMVTGAGGSIGAELCRQIIAREPKFILLVDSSEFSLYSITQEISSVISANHFKITVLPFCANVQNRRLMLTIMKRYSVETVYHAAAYKHVPMVEYNLVEGLQNNVFGTWHTASAAQEAGVKTFVLISTDKAVRPTNFMGATKRLAELCLQALASKQESTRFIMVRFGNVLGSSGSVVPLFKKQILKGGPVTVTHQDVIRYFMTIPEAAQLVIQAAALGEGGDVFVLDMGEPVKIIAMAKQMIHLMGLSVKDEKNPNGDIEIAISGLRPGEKLYEELLIGDNVTGTSHPRILRANEKAMTYEDLCKALDLLRLASATFDAKQARDLMISLPLDYKPSSEICDLLSETNASNEVSTSATQIRLS